jgi:phosphoribosyl 1,2-cyclic phosphodiesterase
MSESEFTVTFWGVRGGYPVPGPKTVEFGGNTTCLQVQAGPHLIVIDAGTGIIGLGARLVAQRAQDRQPIVGTMLFTHGHHDHTQGLSFFDPLRFSDSVFHILGPRVFDADLKDVLSRAILPSLFPLTMEDLVGVRQIRNVREADTILLTQRGLPPIVKDLERENAFVPPWAAKIQMYHNLNHPKGGTTCYRIEYGGKRVVFATDIEGYEGGDTRLIAFARGADLLIHDAEYTEDEYIGPSFSRQGWGHSTWKMAVQVGQKAGVRRLALTHHNADHDDAFMRNIDQEARSVFPEAFMTREGMTIEL